MTEKQFEDALTTAGLWFFLNEYEAIRDWTGEKSKLIDKLYAEGFDRDISGTRTRVNAALRIIESGRAKEAIEKVAKSAKVNGDHPEAEAIAKKILLNM